MQYMLYLEIYIIISLRIINFVYFCKFYDLILLTFNL